MTNETIRINKSDVAPLAKIASQLKKFDQPEWIGKTGYEPRQHKGAHDGRITSLRSTEHAGHKIEIRTTYEITIDGKPYKGHVSVNDDGHLHCHAIPYETYGSAVEFIRTLIDLYPDTFKPVPCEGGES